MPVLNASEETSVKTSEQKMRSIEITIEYACNTDHTDVDSNTQSIQNKIIWTSILINVYSQNVYVQS